MGPSRPAVSLLVTDVDNTLFDWVDIWHSSFSPFLAEISRISGLAQEDLEREVRRVHQRVGTTEYAFLLQDLPILAEIHGTADVLPIYEPAVAAYRDARARAMVPYPTVIPTLDAIRASGARIVAYTESLAFYSALRLRWLELDGRIDVLYSPADHERPPSVDLAVVRTRAPEQYDLTATEHRLTPSGHLKPDTEVLRSIVEEHDIAPEAVVYVGDSLVKDVGMAQAAGVHDVHAAYGAAQHREAYDLLRRVSHWSDDDVDRERELLARPPVTPTTVIESFGELLDRFVFGPAG
jgi:phosphoglycolate phosphatase